MNRKKSKKRKLLAAFSKAKRTRFVKEIGEQGRPIPGLENIQCAAASFSFFATPSE